MKTKTIELKSNQNSLKITINSQLIHKNHHKIQQLIKYNNNYIIQ